MIFQSHLNTAGSILKIYKGSEPFHLFIKKYFSSNKKFGSKDRKQISSLCYNYFRLGQAAKNISTEERILLGTFLCETKPSPILKHLKPEWNNAIEKSFDEKISILTTSFSVEQIFPFQHELSASIDFKKFNQSFLVQPKLFLRARPGNKNKITGKLGGAGIPYKLINESCIELPNAAKVHSIIDLDKEAVVQDYNSQRISEFFSLKTTNHKLQTKVWDCCAASGGKSIMAYDNNEQISLTVSDKRGSILKNLQERFTKAGIKNYTSFVADLTSNEFKIQTTGFDFIIADVPCTGSGTWSRTPEQLFYFDEKKINEYASLQKKIMENVAPALKKGGQLLYITCSILKKKMKK